MKAPFAVIALAAGLLFPAGASAQAMIPPTGMDGADKLMPMNERMNRRFPQPVLVGDLIGLPLLNDHASTLGYVQGVVRTPAGRNEIIVAYNKWFGFFGWLTRPVAVPVEAIGIEGRQLVSLDISSSEYESSRTWQSTDGTALPRDATIAIALARN